MYCVRPLGFIVNTGIGCHGETARHCRPKARGTRVYHRATPTFAAGQAAGLCQVWIELIFFCLIWSHQLLPVGCETLPSAASAAVKNSCFLLFALFGCFTLNNLLWVSKESRDRLSVDDVTHKVCDTHVSNFQSSNITQSLLTSSIWPSSAVCFKSFHFPAIPDRIQRNVQHFNSLAQRCHFRRFCVMLSSMSAAATVVCFWISCKVLELVTSKLTAI